MFAIKNMIIKRINYNEPGLRKWIEELTAKPAHWCKMNIL